MGLKLNHLVPNVIPVSVQEEKIEACLGVDINGDQEFVINERQHDGWVHLEQCPQMGSLHFALFSCNFCFGN